ncbi:MAG: hypothetical protein BKP49_00205 [Treponema sp. CETP13]|nr:MAG: hypothetical protein BKP49_00205 [Treponema sp. CETP13]
MNRFFKCFFLFLIISAHIPLCANADDLLKADVPFIYGEQDFIERIHARTQGKREPIGLVLSGGSARAFAHIGVLKYLEENDIVPDFIISNSMGSIIGLLYSAGYSPDQIYDICNNIPITSLFETTMPINSGILNIQKFLSLMNKLVPENTDIKSFDIPILIVSEDLKTKRKVLITEGDFLQVLQASFALPLYFDSVKYKDHLLVDGGIANIVPLDIAYNYGNNNIVSTTFYSDSILNLTNPLTSLNTSIDIGKRRQGVKELLQYPEAVWIRCSVEDISFMEFTKIEYLTNQGYKSAQKRELELENFNNGIKSPVTKNMKTKRAILEKRIKKIQDDFLIYNHVDTLSFSNTLGFGKWNSISDSDYFFLSDSIGAGTSNTLEWKNLQVNATAGIESQIKNKGWIYPGANLNTTLYISRLKLSLSGDYIFQIDTEKVTSGSLYVNQFLGLNINNSETFKCNLIETTEYINDEENIRKSYWEGTSGLSTVLFKTELNTNKNALHINLGPQFVWQESNITPYIFAKISDKFFICNFPFFIKGTTTSRLTLNQSDSIFLSTNDGYYTTNNEFLTYGIPNQTSEFKNKKNQLFIASFETGYESHTNSSFGEILLFDTISFSAFTNLIWFNIEKPTTFDANFGVYISTNSSIIGLSTINTKFTISYDTSNESMYFGLSVGK